MIPFEELAFAPNREPAERLGAIVGRRFVFSREQWPAWDRLVDKYGWPLLIKAADRCDPTARYCNNVESMAAQIQKAEAELFAPVAAKPTITPDDRARRMADAARLFDAVRNRPMLPPDTMTLTNNPITKEQ